MNAVGMLCMDDWKLSTTVALIIFNRPDTTAEVFAKIAEAKPPKLLVVADGHRPDRPGEIQKCEAARAIIDQVSWDCEVKTNYSERNMGCKLRVSSGISWIFEEVEEAIILEDDCVPHPSFFRYCEELLQRYRHDERIGMISGDNFQFGATRNDYSYYFSRYNHIWGWASWRRAWRYYDRDLTDWPAEFCRGSLRSRFESPVEYRMWSKAFNDVSKGRIDTWDYQWTCVLWLQSMLTVLPSINLVSNIGFGPEATHTVGISSAANLPAEKMEFPLRHPHNVLRDVEADRNTYKKMFHQNIVKRILASIYNFGKAIWARYF